MFGHLVNKPSKDRIYEIVKDAVSIKCEFLTKELTKKKLCFKPFLLIDYTYLIINFVISFIESKRNVFHK